MNKSSLQYAQIGSTTFSRYDRPCDDGSDDEDYNKFKKCPGCGCIPFDVRVIDSAAKGEKPLREPVRFHPSEVINYQSLIKKLIYTFPILKNKSYYLTCIDEHCTIRPIVDDETLLSTLDLCRNKDFYVVYNDDIEISNESSYLTLSYCNVCCFALKRFRYQCLDCALYDLCERCKVKNGSHWDHNMEKVDITIAGNRPDVKIKKIDCDDLDGKIEIGEGHFGKVFKARSSVYNQKVAVKFFKDPCGKDESFQKEIKVLGQLGEHENVVKILGYIDGGMGIVMEHVVMEMDGRELSGLSTYFMYLRDLLSRGQSFKSRELDSFALQIARGMDHLETINIIHRDLATRNVLIDSKKNVKISDFGTSRFGGCYEAEHVFAVRWAAPEVLKSSIYSHKSDVWSFGVVLWEMATLGALPFEGISNSAVRTLVQGGGHLKKPKNVTDRLFKIMQRCWAMRPQNRPTFNALVEKLVDFKWIGLAYREFSNGDGGSDLPDPVELYEIRYNQGR